MGSNSGQNRVKKESRLGRGESGLGVGVTEVEVAL